MATVEDLEQRLAVLEDRFGAVPLAANPPVTIGELTDVPAPGSPIVSPWAQQISARIVHRFATLAARNAATGYQVRGAVCMVDDCLFVHTGAEWIQPGAAFTIVLPQMLNVTGAAIIINSGFTFPGPNRRYLVSINASLFKGAAAGTVNLVPVIAGQNLVTAVFNMTSPEGRVVFFQWIVEAGAAGGSFSLASNGGYVNLEANSFIIVQDAGGIAP